MDRRLLKYLLAGGPSRKMDICAATLKLEEQSETGKVKGLFDSPSLNKSILLKFREQGDDCAISADKLTPTVVYLPFDPHRPEEGGESFVFSQKNYVAFVAARTNRAVDEIDVKAHDCSVLTALDDLPTLSPYLVAEALRKLGVTVDDAYLQVDQKSAQNMQSHVSSYLKPLVATAFGDDHDQLDELVDRFAVLIVDGDDEAALRPLGIALQLQDQEVLKAFTAWAGVTFYQAEFNAIMPRTTALLEWLQKYPLPEGNLPPELKQSLTRSAARLRDNLLADFGSVKQIFSDFNSAYNRMLEHADAQPFRRVLRKAPQHYWQLGDILGRLDQLQGYWDQLAQRNGARHFPFGILEDFYAISGLAYQQGKSTG